MTTDLLAGLAILLGIVGVVLPVLPGVLLVAVTVLVWSGVVGTGEAWAYATVAVLVLATGQVVKYLVPGRRLRDSGVPAQTVLVGGLAGIAGFFIIPVLGLFAGFVAGVYLAEVSRVGKEHAWPSTTAALRAVGLSILIELFSVLAAAAVWLVGAFAT